MHNLREYGKEHGAPIAASAVAVILWFGFLACSRTIRIDTEELINRPGTTVGWLTIGRFSLALFKRLLGLGTWRPVKSGVLFLLFFWLGANLLTYALYRFSGKRREYPYGVFLLLYVTSQIWSYQVYFTLQQAEVALAMLLLVIAAVLAVWACFAPRQAEGADPRWRRVCALAAAAVLLVAGLGAYQALAAYYIVICIALFLMYLCGHRERAADGCLRPVCVLAAHFVLAYLVYSFIANTWFMAASDYMENQMGWGRLPVTECVKNVLRTARNILAGYGPRNFSFYAAGVVFTLLTVPAMWKRAGEEGSRAARTKLIWQLLALAGIAAAPFLMTIYMGEMLVARSQFALPVSAAFFAMYGIGRLREMIVSGADPSAGGTGVRRARGILRLACLCVAVTIAIQGAYQFILQRTDRIRFEQDQERTQLLLDELSRANGGVLPEVPVIFVGYQPAETDGISRRTEMYGWSFYEWDYSADNPTGATHRIAGFVQADTGNRLNESATEAQKETAAATAAFMPDFPAEGSVRVTGEYVVVRLSEVVERTDHDWW